MENNSFSVFFQLSIEVVELDPCIAEIAKSWFEFKDDERMKVIIEDGLKYIERKGLFSAFLRLICIKARSIFTSFYVILFYYIFCFVLFLVAHRRIVEQF